MRLTLKETRERERLIQKWIAEGDTIHDMARKLDVRPEAVRRFLKVRDWLTDNQREYRQKKRKTENG